MLAAQHVLHYLRGTYELGIWYHRNAFLSNRTSSGVGSMQIGGPISCKSRLQDSVDLSTSEAEYMAASLCGQEVVYIRAILRKFGAPHTQPSLIYEDNGEWLCLSNPFAENILAISIFADKHVLRISFFK
jgi:hypothetical protein